MNEKSTIKDLEAQAQNTRHLMDRLNRAAYGFTMAELIQAVGNREPAPREQDLNEKEDYHA